MQRGALPAAMLACAAAPAIADEPPAGLGAYVTLATDARDRGLSQVDDEPAVRAGIDYEHASGLFAGGVLGNVAYPGDAYPGAQPDSVLELYAGRVWRASRWSITTSFGHYRYSGTPDGYDYNEISAVFDYRDRWFYRVTYADDLLASGYGVADHELGFRTPLPGRFELGAAIGRVGMEAPYADDYTHYNIGVSRLVGRFGLDLRHYSTSRELAAYYGSSAGERWALSLSYAIRSGP